MADEINIKERREGEERLEGEGEERLGRVDRSRSNEDLKREEVKEGVFLLELKGHRMRDCLLYTSPSPRDLSTSRMPSSA